MFKKSRACCLFQTFLQLPPAVQSDQSKTGCPLPCSDAFCFGASLRNEEGYSTPCDGRETSVSPPATQVKIPKEYSQMWVIAGPHCWRL